MLASNKLQGFTQRELEIVLDRIDRDRRDSKPDKLTWQKFRRHVTNWELWVYGFMYVVIFPQTQQAKGHADHDN